MTCVLVVIYNAFIFYSVIKQIEHSYFLLVIIFVKIFKENFIIPLHPTFSTLSLIWARLLGFKPVTPGQQLDALPPSYRSNLLVGLPECVEEEKNLAELAEYSFLITSNAIAVLRQYTAHLSAKQKPNLVVYSAPKIT